MNEVRLQTQPIGAEALAETLDPHWRWNRALPAPGHMGVDFEVRVDFRRPHAYRLGRIRSPTAIE